MNTGRVKLNNQYRIEIIMKQHTHIILQANKHERIELSLKMSAIMFMQGISLQGSLGMLVAFSSEFNSSDTISANAHSSQTVTTSVHLAFFRSDQLA